MGKRGKCCVAAAKSAYWRICHFYCTRTKRSCRPALRSVGILQKHLRLHHKKTQHSVPCMAVSKRWEIANWGTPASALPRLIYLYAPGNDTLHQIPFEPHLNAASFNLGCEQPGKYHLQPGFRCALTSLAATGLQCLPGNGVALSESVARSLLKCRFSLPGYRNCLTTGKCLDLIGPAYAADIYFSC